MKNQNVGATTKHNHAINRETECYVPENTQGEGGGGQKQNC